jgi:hypothetical protein
MGCNRCKNKICLKSGHPCREVENLLERVNAKNGYSARHIRRKEIPYSPQGIDLASLEALGNIRGRRVVTRQDDENPE